MHWPRWYRTPSFPKAGSCRRPLTGEWPPPWLRLLYRPQKAAASRGSEPYGNGAGYFCSGKRPVALRRQDDRKETAKPSIASPSLFRFADNIAGLFCVYSAKSHCVSPSQQDRFSSFPRDVFHRISDASLVYIRIDPLRCGGTRMRAPVPEHFILPMFPCPCHPPYRRASLLSQRFLRRAGMPTAQPYAR